MNMGKGFAITTNLNLGDQNLGSCIDWRQGGRQTKSRSQVAELDLRPRVQHVKQHGEYSLRSSPFAIIIAMGPASIAGLAKEAFSLIG